MEMRKRAGVEIMSANDNTKRANVIYNGNGGEG